MLQLFPEPKPVQSVSMTRLRPHLRQVIEAIHAHNSKILITHHGQQVAAIVSIGDFWRIWEDEELELYGPKNPETGKRPGGGWVKRNGWKKGMAVEWIDGEPLLIDGAVAAVAEEGEEEKAQATEKKPRGWWRFW